MGLDLQGFTGDTVVAAADGVVALVDDFLLAGNLVYLNHGGGVVSGYFHLSEQLVRDGRHRRRRHANWPGGRDGARDRAAPPLGRPLRQHDRWTRAAFWPWRGSGPLAAEAGGPPEPCAVPIRRRALSRSGKPWPP